MTTQITTGITIRLIDQFRPGMRAIESSMQRFKSSLNGVKFPSVARFAADLNQAGEAMTRFGMGITGALKSSVDEFASFEAKMSRLKAIGEYNPIEMGNFDKILSAEAARAGFKGPEVVDLAIDYAAIGKNFQQVVEMTPITLDIAKIEGITPHDVSEKFGTSAHLLGIDAKKDLAALSDAMIGASTISRATFSTLSEFISGAGTGARMLGMSTPTILAFGTAMDEAGIHAGDADTAFRNMGLRFANITDPARKAFKEIGFGAKGIESLRDQINSGDMIGALKRMGEGMEGLTGLQKEGVLGKIFEAFTAVPAMKMIEASMDPESEKSLQTYKKKFEELWKAGHEGANKTGAMAKAMTDNLAGDMARAESSVALLQKSIGKMLEPRLRSLLSTFSGVVASVGDWAAKNPELTTTLVQVAAAVGALSVAGGTALFALSGMTISFGVMAKGLSWGARAFEPIVRGIASIGGISGMISGIGTALSAIGAALTGPVAIIAALVAATAVGAYYAYKWMDRTGKLSEWFSTKFKAIGEYLRANLEFLVGLGTMIGIGLYEGAKAAFEAIVLFGKWAGRNIVGAWRAVGSFFGEVWAEVKDFASTAFGWVGKYAGRAADWVVKQWSSVANFFGGIWKGIADKFHEFLDPIFGKLENVVSKIREAGRETLGAVFGDNKDEKKSITADLKIDVPKLPEINVPLKAEKPPDWFETTRLGGSGAGGGSSGDGSSKDSKGPEWPAGFGKLMDGERKSGRYRGRELALPDFNIPSIETPQIELPPMLAANPYADDAGGGSPEGVVARAESERETGNASKAQPGVFGLPRIEAPSMGAPLALPGATGEPGKPGEPGNSAEESEPSKGGGTGPAKAKSGKSIESPPDRPMTAKLEALARQQITETREQTRDLHQLLEALLAALRAKPNTGHPTRTTQGAF